VGGGGGGALPSPHSLQALFFPMKRIPLSQVKKAFGQVKIHKPDASRSESSELFVHAAAFRGRALREIAAQQGEGEVGVAGGPPPVMPGGAARGGARENA